MGLALNSPQTIGILGGGQLARMTLEAAMRFGVHCHVLDKNADAPAVPYTRYFTQGDALDFDTVMRFGAACDVVTIDSEHVNAAALIALAASGKRVYPSGAVLATIQNKCRQKEFLAARHIPTAKFRVFASRAELKQAKLDFPCVQKMATAGYDGYGVKVLQSAADLDTAFDGESLIEEKIDIAKEIAVIVATAENGKFVVYEAVEMVFDPQRNILSYQICPAQIEGGLLQRAAAIATNAAAQLGVRGLIAVEMFLTQSGEILVNEMAPRPHNSGHHTIEAAATSQYENLVRILLNLPLGSAETTSPSLMMNLLGPEAGREKEFAAMIARAQGMPGVRVHWYGKKDLRPFRKLGHITITGERAELLKQYSALTKT
ncbi:MAG: 5-(carboxyamino)imidazole ribonucleotide synthase [Turneriella sp.]|nr:5-(carboxyamino)imidazole ribonucleotide synthase [Turneriella sp.]